MKYTLKNAQEILEENYPNNDLLLLLENLDIIMRHGDPADETYHIAIESKNEDKAIWKDRELLVTDQGLKCVIALLDEEARYQKEIYDGGTPYEI